MSTLEITFEGGRGRRREMFPPVGRFFLRALGCWHRELGRLVTFGGETYRVCLGCGARRRLDLRRWETSGPFYFGRSGVIDSAGKA